MNFLAPLLEVLRPIRDIIASLLSTAGFSHAVTLGLANFSLGVIIIVPLIIWPQLALLIIVVLLLFQIVKR